MKQLEIIDFLKGYSIFTIVIYHFLGKFELPNPLNQLIFFGGTGVHLFILLSGFGLYLSYLNKPLNFVPFIKRRVSKIYLPYIFVVLISALLSFFIPLYTNSLYAIGGHVFLYKMFDESIMNSFGYQLWFISTILQFYVVFHALVFLEKKTNPISFLIICLGLSIVWVIVVISIGRESERIWNSFFLQYLWEFAFGMSIASTLFKNNYRINLKLKPVYFLIFGLLNCALYGVLAIKFNDSGKMMNDLPALLGYTSLAIWIYQLDIKMVNAFILFTSKISFSIYLLHILVLHTALILLDMLPMPLTLMIALLMSYLVSIYYQKLITLFYKIIKI